MFSYGNTSEEKLKTCHKDLQLIFRLAIKRSKVDFGISEGHRDIKLQLQYFNEGKSKVDGIKVKGKHNFLPSEAVDIYVYHPVLETRRKLAYDKSHLSYIAGVVDSCTEELFAKGEITHKIRWGANWNSDGVIDYDQNFDDFPHFELLKP